jgi:hypothetical protein
MQELLWMRFYALVPQKLWEQAVCESWAFVQNSRSVDDSSRVWIYFTGMSRIILAVFTIIFVFKNQNIIGIWNKCYVPRQIILINVVMSLEENVYQKLILKTGLKVKGNLSLSFIY